MSLQSPPGCEVGRLPTAHSYSVGPRRIPCEQDALQQIAQSPDSVVKLTRNWSVLEWNTNDNIITTERNGALLYWWNITREPKRYYHEQ